MRTRHRTLNRTRVMGFLLWTESGVAGHRENDLEPFLGRISRACRRSRFRPMGKYDFLYYEKPEHHHLIRVPGPVDRIIFPWALVNRIGLDSIKCLKRTGDGTWMPDKVALGEEPDEHTVIAVEYY